MSPKPPTATMTPFANETEAQDIGELTIENRLDQVTIYGSLVLSKDAVGLERALQLKDLLTQVVSVLEGEENLPGKRLPMPAEFVKNPFG